MTIANSYQLDWQGPFTYQRAVGESCFDSWAAKEPGVYLWTFEYRDGYLIYIPGLTMASFAERLGAYINLFRQGKYTILNGLSAQRGIRDEIWHGLLWDKTPGRKEMFSSRQVEYERAADEMMSKMRIFLAPLRAERRVVPRIEAAIIDILYSGVGPVHDLPDKGMHREPRQLIEEPFTVRSNAHVLLHGLPSSFEA